MATLQPLQPPKARTQTKKLKFRMRRVNEKGKSTPVTRLIENAFYFLRSALSDLKKDRQRSVIDFYTAVELFLKARLVAEHWSLIVTKDPDRDKFDKGDFVSVTFDDACARIKGVLGQGISEEARKSFNVIRLHRNKMVHFFHSGDGGSELGDIALEQLQAWCHLNRLVTGEWNSAFPTQVSQKMRNIERSLVVHREYARERYKQLAHDIGNETRSGAIFVKCPSCTMTAALSTDIEPWLRSYDCRVCFNSWADMDSDCPECETPAKLKAFEPFACKAKGCGHKIDADDLYSFLNDEVITKDNMLDLKTPANCDECQSYHAVCSHRGIYLCTNCLSTSHDLYTCGWCGEHGTERREYSQWFGCAHCGGRSEHIKDD